MFVFVKEHFLSFPQGSGNNKSKKSLKPPPKEVVNCFGSLTYVQNLIQQFLRNIHMVLNHHRRKIYQPYLQWWTAIQKQFQLRRPYWRCQKSCLFLCVYFRILEKYQTPQQTGLLDNHTTTCNPNDLYFEGQPLKNNTFSNQKKGHLGSRKLFKKTCSNKNNREESHIKNFALPSNSRDYQPSGFTGQNIPYGGSVFPAKLSRKHGICAWPRCLKKVKKYSPKMMVNDGDESYDTIQLKKSEKNKSKKLHPRKLTAFEMSRVLLTSKKTKNPQSHPNWVDGPSIGLTSWGTFEKRPGFFRPLAVFSGGIGENGWPFGRTLFLGEFKVVSFLEGKNAWRCIKLTLAEVRPTPLDGRFGQSSHGNPSTSNMAGEGARARDKEPMHDCTYGGFLKWWYPTTIGFPTKNAHSGVFWGYHHLRKHPYRHIIKDHIHIYIYYQYIWCIYYKMQPRVL